VANNNGGTVSVISIPGYRVLYELDVKPDIEERRSEWSLIHRAVNQYAGWKYADDIRVSPDGKILYVSRASICDVAAFSLAERKLLWRESLLTFLY